MSKKSTKIKILIINQKQFGYHTDTYMYCKYINKENYEIEYIGFDFSLPKYEVDRIKVHYVPLHRYKILRYFSYSIKVTRLLRQGNFNIAFQIRQKFPLSVRLLNLTQLIILDIRTGDVSKNKIKNYLRNKYTYLISIFYNRITIISESLAEKLNLKKQKLQILPLGAELLDLQKKEFNSFRLLYVGTLDNRNIHETVLGLSLFLEKNKSTIVHYDIVGFGKKKSLEILEKSILDTGLNKQVIYHGRRKLDELLDFYNKCNIGIVYVPILPIYQCQPPTKLFESLLAGMPVIATDTFENRKNLSNSCGELTNDNPEAFSIALQKLVSNSDQYDSETIKNHYRNFEWANIVRDLLEPYIEGIYRYEN